MSVGNIVRYWLLRGGVASVALLFAAITPAFAQCGTGPANLPGTWCPVDGPHVRVWWDQAFVLEGDEVKATQVRDAVEASLWPLFEGFLGRVPLSDGDRTYLFNGRDGRYDIVLASQLTAQYGDSPLVFRTTSAAPPARFSMVRRTLIDAKLLAAVAHQLMRGFLTSFACASQCQWFEEATATWAEHLAYPTRNTEHAYAKHLFQKPQLSLDYDPTVADQHKFGAYVFLLNLQKRVHVGANIVRHIWDAIEVHGSPVAAIDATVPGGFKGVWRQFIIDNWNTAPAVVAVGTKLLPIYQAWDKLTSGVYSRKGYLAAPLMNMSSPQTLEVSLNATLPPLSAKYYAIGFDLSVRSVRIDHNLKRLRTAGVTGAELVVFTKRTGQDWAIEPAWDGENSHSYCRDAATAHIEQIVVILGNSSPTASVSFLAGGVTPKVVAGGNSCLTDPEAGYEECRLDIPLNTKTVSGIVKTYQHFETQTWQITGLKSVTTAGRTYYYGWTATGKGKATSVSSSESETHTWTLTGFGSATVLIGIGQTPSGQIGQKLSFLDPQIAFANGVQITSRQTDSSGTKTITSSASAFEYPRPRWTTAPAPQRIEGYAVTPLTGWEPGQGQIGSVGTISCRWSWPGVH